MQFGQERYIALENGEGNSYGRTTRNIQVEQKAQEEEALEQAAAQQIVQQTATEIALQSLGY